MTSIARRIPPFMQSHVVEDDGEVLPDMEERPVCVMHDRIVEEQADNRVGIAKLDTAIFWMKIIAGSLIGGMCSFAVVAWAVFYPVVCSHSEQLSKHWANIERNNQRLLQVEEERKDNKVYQQAVENKLEAIRKLILDTHFVEKK